MIVCMFQSIHCKKSNIAFQAHVILFDGIKKLSDGTCRQKIGHILPFLNQQLASTAYIKQAQWLRGSRADSQSGGWGSSPGATQILKNGLISPYSMPINNYMGPIEFRQLP